jgi:UDP-N-acetyl-D-mannosaminuronate dehydrogenase
VQGSLPAAKLFVSNVTAKSKLSPITNVCIVGLGHVGLPLVRFARAGATAVGLDIDENKIK